jgi:hypothetical protein
MIGLKQLDFHCFLTEVDPDFQACINLFIGIITTIVVFVLENFDDDELKQVGAILKDVFLIFPQYCLGRGLLEMAIEYNSNLVASQFGKISYGFFYKLQPSFRIHRKSKEISLLRI